MLVGILAGLILATASWHGVIKIGNETATVQNLKTIAAVEAAYFYGHNHRFAAFEELTRERLVTEKFSGKPIITDGYVFTLAVRVDPPSYTLSAEPQSHATGTKHFYLDPVSRQIQVNRNQAAGPQDPLLAENETAVDR